jgi:hypothetical protein
VELEAMCDVSPDEESSMPCSRVRPVNKVRRRRIIDTYGLHHRLPKAAKVETTNFFSSVADQVFSAVLRIRDILVYGSGSVDPYLLLTDPDPSIIKQKY